MSVNLDGTVRVGPGHNVLVAGGDETNDFDTLREQDEISQTSTPTRFL